MGNLIIDNAKVMSKGQITLPKEIRMQLGVDTMGLQRVRHD